MKDSEGSKPETPATGSTADGAYGRRYGAEAIRLLRAFVAADWRPPPGALTVTVSLTMLAAEYELAQLIAYAKEAR